MSAMHLEMATGKFDATGIPLGDDHAKSIEPPRRETLPFTVKIVSNEAELEKAVRIRHAAYARHVPAFAEKLKVAEETDFEPGAVVLLAQSKLDGSPLGTMRIQTNRYAPLSLEQSVHLPDWLQGLSLAEATRLGVSEERQGRLVKTVLFKAYFLYCQQAGIDWMVIAGRKPIDRQYDALLFRDVFAENEFIPMRHAADIAHRVMAFEICSARRRWAAASHPLYQFVFETRHPDIDLAEREDLEMPSYLPPLARPMPRANALLVA